MSAWAKQRRFFIIFSFFVIISFVLVVLVYFLIRENQTCFDGIQNQFEAGIDCGGECNLTCPIPDKPLFNVWTNTFSIARGVYSGVAYIENQNENLYVPSVQYEIKFFDSKGEFVKSNSQNVVINAKGVTPIFIPFINSGERKIAMSFFSFVEKPQFVQPPEEFSFITIESGFENHNKEPRVYATVRSSSGTNVGEAAFVVILYDNDNNAIAASSTIVQDIVSNTEYDLAYTWVNPFVLDDGICNGFECDLVPARIEIIPVIQKW